MAGKGSAQPWGDQRAQLSLPLLAGSLLLTGAHPFCIRSHSQRKEADREGEHVSVSLRPVLLPEAGRFLGQHGRSVGRHPPSQAVPDTCISRLEVLSTTELLGSSLVLVTQGLPQRGFCSVLVYVLIQVAGTQCFVL